MANDKHCDKCGGFEFKDGSCGKCESENGVIDQNNKFEGKKQQKNIQNSFRTVDSLNFANTLIKAKQDTRLEITFMDSTRATILCRFLGRRSIKSTLLFNGEKLKTAVLT